MNQIVKILLIIIIFINLFSCRNKSGNNRTTDTSHIENCKEEDVFEAYRKNINKKDVSKIEKTFKLSHSDEVASIIYFNKEINGISTNFIENNEKNLNLEKDFNMVFSKDFIKCFNELNLNTLFKQGKANTKNYHIQEGEVCRIISTFDKSSHIAKLILLYEFEEDGDKYESSINYSYSFNGCDLKMTNLTLVN